MKIKDLEVPKCAISVMQQKILMENLYGVINVHSNIHKNQSFHSSEF